MPVSLISSVTHSGNPYVDGVLHGTKWNKTTVPTITYSFPTDAGAYKDDASAWYTSSGFSVVSDQQIVAMKDILGGATGYTSMFSYGSFSSVIDYAFANVASPTDGTEDTAIIRIAQSNRPGTAEVSDFPSDNPDGGDIWFGTAYAGTINDFRTPTLGSYAWYTAIHEAGHAMGLKHGHQSYLPGHSNVPPDRNAMEFTIMTYATYLGDVTSGASNERYGFAQTLMMYDIAALQYMYGANFTTHAGASVYRWDPLTGEMFIREDGGAFVGQGRPGGPDAPNDGTANRVFLTIWDGDGIDTYDMSNYTNGVSIDLRPGQWSITSASQLANLNGYYANNPIYAHGNVYNALQYEGDTRSLIENAIGGAGNDTLMGNDADNTLDGGAGIDSMAGGNGNDTYIVDNVLDEVLEAADAGIDTVRSSVTYTLTTNVEDLILIGKATIHGTGNALDNVITGNTAGNVLDGGDGNDTLYGGGGLDTLIGGFGDDWLDGGLYTDSMVGGDGNDTYIVDNFLDKVIEAAGVGSGIDTVMSSVTYTLTANVENLILIGSATINGTGNTLDNAITGNGATNLLRGGDGNDTMDGAGGNDYLYGENDSDSLDGGNGNDLLDGGAGNDTLAGGAGLDTLIGGEGDDRLLGEGGNDSLTGGNGNDFLNGGAASDYLNGGAGDDELKGGNGNDTLIGGAGNDTLDGGDGSDLFVFDTTPGVTNVDLILNFNAAEDTIQLQRYWSFSGLSGTGTLGAGAFWSGAGLSAAHDGNDRIVFDTSSGALYYDADGAGGTAAVQFATVDLITLTGAITNVDFLVV